MAEPVSAQLADPFTDAELITAYQIAGASGAEAASTVARWRAAQHHMTDQLRALMDGELTETSAGLPPGVAPSAGAQLSEDLVVILSLISPELEAKTERYRSQFRAGEPESGEERGRWIARREALRPWVLERLQTLQKHAP
jgi:hypothetical protein